MALSQKTLHYAVQNSHIHSCHVAMRIDRPCSLPTEHSYYLRENMSSEADPDKWTYQQPMRWESCSATEQRSHMLRPEGRNICVNLLCFVFRLLGSSLPAAWPGPSKRSMRSSEGHNTSISLRKKLWNIPGIYPTGCNVIEESYFAR